MAKKIITPEEYKEKQAKKAAKRKKFFESFLKTLALCLAIALVYSTTTIAYTRIEMLTPDEVVDADGGLKDGFEDTDSGDSGTTDAGTTDSGNSGNSGSTDSGATNSGTQSTPDKGASTADQEILDMYKKGVTAARTKSASVIRVKDGAINYKGIVEAGPLTSIADFLMGIFMVKDEASIEVKNEDWDKTKLPNPSALTLNGVQKITREDKGNTYVITVIAKNATNPKEGADGVGSVAGVIEESQITGAVGSYSNLGLSIDGISIDYENVTAVATIDKATGNCIALNLNAPCYLNIAHAKVPFIGEIDNAKVGIQVITEYKISY